MIFLAGDFRVLHFLYVELDLFDTDRCDGSKVLDLMHDIQRLIDAGLQTGRQPSGWAMAILKPSWAVSRFAAPPSSAQCAPRIQSGFDAGFVNDFSEETAFVPCNPSKMIAIPVV